MTLTLTDIAFERGYPIDIYLACPYWHVNPEVREWRYRAAVIAAATLVARGRTFFSPIGMTHQAAAALASVATAEEATLADAAKHPELHRDYWSKLNRAYLPLCDSLLILALPGWRESAGVRYEREYFEHHKRPIALMQMEELILPLDYPTMDPAW